MAADPRPVCHVHMLSMIVTPIQKSVRAHIGVLRVGRTIQVITITFKRKRMGPKYKGTVLFMKMLQHNVMPERVDNYYACAAISDTTLKYVRFQDLCTILAEVIPRNFGPDMVNLVPIAHAFPVSWCAD